jgi:enoyl-CoA hydratase
LEYNNILFETKNHFAIVTINRPDKLNALNSETLVELSNCFTSINDDPNIYVVIVTGAGEKAFVAGADISEIAKLNSESAETFSVKGQAIFDQIAKLGKPVIAAVNGFALGGGCELALACHIRYASEKAKFGQPEVNLGIIPGYGGTQRLTRLINSGYASELILTGELIDADEALRIGLVSKVFIHDELLHKTIMLAEKIASKGQQAINHALRSINSCSELSESDGLKLESQLFAKCCDTNDFKEGTQAFLEKRKPNFTNH